MVINDWMQDEAIAHGDMHFWDEMSNGNPCHIDRIATRRGYDAVCDFPCASFFFDFLEYFPDAKVGSVVGLVLFISICILFQESLHAFFDRLF